MLAISVWRIALNGGRNRGRWGWVERGHEKCDGNGEWWQRPQGINKTQLRFSYTSVVPRLVCLFCSRYVSVPVCAFGIQPNGFSIFHGHRSVFGTFGKFCSSHLSCPGHSMLESDSVVLSKMQPFSVSFHFIHSAHIEFRYRIVFCRVSTDVNAAPAHTHTHTRHNFRRVKKKSFLVRVSFIHLAAVPLCAYARLRRKSTKV